MQSVGKLLLGFSLIASVVGGLYLAAEVSRTQSFDAMFPIAFVLFAAVSAATAGGIYLYARGEQRDVTHVSETSLQRTLVESLAGKDSVTFASLSEVLAVSISDVGQQLRELTRIDVLPAAINWDIGVLYPRHGGYLLDVTNCLHCGQQLPDGEIPHTCLICRTEHYDV